MMVFCPFCRCLLSAEYIVGQIYFSCTACPVKHPLKRTHSSRTYYELKELDDVLGGAEAWQNVDSTEERCPKCSHPKAYFMQVQIRSADEPMTTFYHCCNTECSHTWRD